MARVTTSGVVTEFPNVFSGVWGITAGPDGRVWFAGGLGIGAISSTGVVEPFPLPGPARRERNAACEPLTAHDG